MKWARQIKRYVVLSIVQRDQKGLFELTVLIFFLNDITGVTSGC
jgi:hypothetical protein